MASKIYTAQEMRDAAAGVEIDGCCANSAKDARTCYVVATMLCQAANALERKDREIDELKKQASIAKDAFFKISQREHSREVHGIVCEAEFMMNHPECRNEVTNG